MTIGTLLLERSRWLAGVRGAALLKQPSSGVLKASEEAPNHRACGAASGASSP